MKKKKRKHKKKRAAYLFGIYMTARAFDGRVYVMPASDDRRPCSACVLRVVTMSTALLLSIVWAGVVEMERKAQSIWDTI